MEKEQPYETESLLNNSKRVEEKVSDCQIKTSDVTYFSLYRYSTICERVLLVFGLFLAVVCSLGPPLQAFLAGDVIGGSIINYAALQYNLTNLSEKEILNEKLLAETKLFAIMASSVGLGTIILSYVVGALFSYCALAQVSRIRKLYIKKILNMDIEWFELNNTGDFATSFIENLSFVEDAIGEKMGLFFTYESTFLVGMVLVLITGWQLALVALVHYPVSLFLMAVLSWLTSKFSKAEVEANSLAGSVAEEVLASIRTVVAFGGQKKELERYKKYVAKAKENSVLRNILLGTGNGILSFIAYSSITLTFWYGVQLMQGDKMKPEEEAKYTPAVLFSIFGCTLVVSSSFSQAIPYIEMFSIAKEKIDKIYKILSTEPKINTYKKTGVELKHINGDIVFDNVHFKYPSRPDTQVLNGLNLEIKKGETTALIGSSGCGKSTCLQLIQRFYDASFGNIFIDGHNINDLNLVSLRSHISVVGQEPVLFTATIAENIRYGRLNATQEDIEKAARRANAHQFIKKLPEGYQTLVGGTGSHLSGGQKQRIAIARALIREPSILLLDEATSALDTASETEVQAAIDQIKGECTTVIVAHRLSTIKNSDKIVMLSEGRVIEQGTHSQLVLLRGAYYELVKHQVIEDGIQQDAGEIKSQETSVSMESLIIESKLVHPKESSTSSISSKKVKKAVLLEILKMNKPEWKYILLGCICSILIGIASPAYSIIFADFIILLVNRNYENIMSQFKANCFYMLGIGGVLLVTGSLQGLAFGISGENLTQRLRNKMFETILKQDMRWFDEKENGVGAICARLSGETSSVQGASGVRLGSTLNALITFILAVIFAMYYEWSLTLVMLALSPFLFFVTYLSIKIEAGDAAGNQKAFESSSKVVLEAAVNIKTVASLSCENVFYEKFSAELVPYIKKAKKSLNYRAAVLALHRTYIPFVDSAGILYAAVLMTKGMPYSTYFITAEVILNGCLSLGSAFSFSVNLQKGILAAGRICEFLRRSPTIKNLENASKQPWDKSNVEYDDVSFSYPTRPGLSVLRGFNLSVAPGSTVALVGSSGCGKSTIVQLLERFYDPVAGQVTVDERDIRTVDLPSLRNRLGIVSQEPNLFNRTIAENIAYGDNDREVSMEEIIKAARDANIHDFISTLPLGYETSSGANGVQLSGGQKQRVAIARALIREPTILLLDEATSALDSESEKIVQEALNRAKMGRTCITIAHRLTTIQDADLICVVKDGAIAEMGTHAELMDKEGCYYELYKLQSIST